MKATELADVAERIAFILQEHKMDIHVVAETLLGENYKKVLQIDTRLKNDKLINEIILLWYKKQLNMKGGQEPRHAFAKVLFDLGDKLKLISKFQNIAQELDAYYYRPPHAQ